MANNNDDLGFVPDQPANEHDDLGFVPDEEQPQDLAQMAGKIPVIGGPLQSALEMREAAKRGAVEGATLGFSGEMLGGLSAAGKTAAEAVGGQIPEDQSAIDRLKANYEKYKQVAELGRTQAEEKAPLTYELSKLAGMTATTTPILSAAAPAGMLARLGTMTGLGALIGAGESEKPGQLGSDITKGAELGLAGGAVGEAVAPVLGKVAEKAINYGQQNEYLKQLAATIKNAGEGGTLFSQPGKQAVAQNAENFASQTAEDIVKNLPEKNKLYEQAFQQAAEQGAKLEPSSDILDSYNTFLNQMDNSSIKVPDELKEGFVRLQEGDLDPQEGFSLIRKLNDIKFAKTNPKTPQSEAISNLIGDLTQATNETLPSNTLEQLNLGKQTAHQAVEPFIQKSGEARFNPKEFTNFSSEYTQNELRSKVKNYFDDLLNRVGEGTAQGTDLQNQLKQGIQYFNNLESQAPLSTDFAKIAQDAQNLGYLNTARRVTSGINERTGQQAMGVSKLTNKLFTSPFKVAEKISGSESAQTVANALLSGDQKMLGIASQKLIDNPSTAHLGRMLANPRDQRTLNQTVFTIMQNPLAKSMLGIEPEEK